MTRSIFISCSGTDIAEAGALRDLLVARHGDDFDVWLDEGQVSISGGRRTVPRQAGEVIGGCDGFIFYFGSGSMVDRMQNEARLGISRAAVGGLAWWSGDRWAHRRDAVSGASRYGRPRRAVLPRPAQ